METGNKKMEKTVIKNFQDLTVYQSLYKAMLLVHRQILPNLPKEERLGLADQMRRASKAGPALLAEGFAKRYQKLYWKKYLTDAIGECNEMIHHLSICIDIYETFVSRKICEEAREIYQITCKQLTRLGQVWQNYHEAGS